MSVETDSKLGLSERVVEGNRYSRDDKLDQFLKKIDEKLGNLSEEGMSPYEMVDRVGFQSAEIRTLTLNFFHHSQMHGFFRIEMSEETSGACYNREQVLVAAAAVQVRLQCVVWDNLPYVLHHYLVDPELKAVISKPTIHYNSERAWGHATAIRNRALTNLDAEVVYPEPESLDLSSESILSDFPSELFPKPWEKVVQKSVRNNIVIKGNILPQKPQMTLPVERLEELYTLLAQAALGAFPQMDSISPVRFQDTGFNIEEIEAVFDEYDKLRGKPARTFTDEDKTYYALGRALDKILRSGISIQKNTNAFS